MINAFFDKSVLIFHLQQQSQLSEKVTDRLRHCFRLNNINKSLLTLVLTKPLLIGTVLIENFKIYENLYYYPKSHHTTDYSNFVYNRLFRKQQK